MSTYNGEKYIKEQINSILNQKGVNVLLYIRDDGSSDGTSKILCEYMKKYNNVIVSLENNLGFRNSFFKALKDAPDADYYAFSDQDDYWFPEKLLKTIDLFADNEQYVLGFKNASLTDDCLKPFGVLYEPDKRLLDSSMTFIDAVGYGFLIVFDKKIRDCACRINESIPISHDILIGAIASYFGNIKFDNEIVALYRRLPNSVSRNKIFKTLLHRIGSMFLDRGVNPICAELFLRYYPDLLNDESKKQLTDLKIYRSDFTSKLRLLQNKELRYKGIIGWIALKTKILINRH
jgi:rhamnosyltransferase